MIPTLIHYSDIVSDMYHVEVILSGLYSDILPGIYSDIPSDIQLF